MTELQDWFFAESSRQPDVSRETLPTASKALQTLAKEIDQAIHEAKGHLTHYDIPLDRWIELHQDQAAYNGGTGLALRYDRPNFVWRGIPVCAS